MSEVTLTREWLLDERKFWADQVKTNTPLDIGIRLRVATCDLALQSLSQEAVRNEVQDRIDAGRYRHWRNAKVGEASHDYHFDDLLGKIENVCDLANEIDAAIDADMQRLGKQP
jgi:hypothetical protein